MNKRHSFILLLILFSVIAFTQKNNDVKQTYRKIFELCSKSDYKNAASYFVFTGKGKDSFKRPVNPENKKEFLRIKRICKKIKGLLKISSSYEISDPVKQKNKYKCKARFISGKQNLHFNLIFVKIGNKFFLENFK